MQIAVISVYFGKWVPYHKLWLKSCECNPEIDFFVIGDQKMDDLPNNVHIINISLNEIRALASQKLGRDISLKTPYKLCDYKPMYGLIFEEYLQGYDYWGHCDMDMIFGNISKFLKMYEVESMRNSSILDTYRSIGIPLRIIEGLSLTGANLLGSRW